MYEMLYGTTPFRGTTRDDTFSNIRKTTINFPEYALLFIFLSFFFLCFLTLFSYFI